MSNEKEVAVICSRGPLCHVHECSHRYAHKPVHEGEGCDCRRYAPCGQLFGWQPMVWCKEVQKS